MRRGDYYATYILFSSKNTTVSFNIHFSMIPAMTYSYSKSLCQYNSDFQANQSL